MYDGGALPAAEIEFLGRVAVVFMVIMILLVVYMAGELRQLRSHAKAHRDIMRAVENFQNAWNRENG